MSIVITDLGHTSDIGNPTKALTGLTVAAGSLIVFCVVENSSATPFGTVADSAGNSYTSIASGGMNNSVSNGTGQIFYAWNVAALSSGSITYTKNTAGASVVISALSATGIQTSSTPLDSAVTNSAFGSSAAPTVTSGLPGSNGELIVGALFWDNGTLTFTQDSTNGAFATPPDLGTGFAGPRSAGGNIIQGGSAATQIYAPTLSSAAHWWEVIVGFTPASPIAPSMPISRIIRRRMH